MKIETMLLVAGAAVIAIWLIGLFVNVAAWVLEAAVIIFGALLISHSLMQFIASRSSKKS